MDDQRLTVLSRRFTRCPAIRPKLDRGGRVQESGHQAWHVGRVVLAVAVQRRDHPAPGMHHAGAQRAALAAAGGMADHAQLRRFLAGLGKPVEGRVRAAVVDIKNLVSRTIASAVRISPISGRILSASFLTGTMTVSTMASSPSAREGDEETSVKGGAFTLNVVGGADIRSKARIGTIGDDGKRK